MKWTILTLSFLALASCQKNGTLDPTLDGFFPQDAGEVRKTEQFLQVSAASGARADAMLSKQHFDGQHLNSLGEEKLSLMLKDDDAVEPMVVYLNINEQDPATKNRRASVITFLKDKGLADNQISLVYGDNPATRSPAAVHLAKLAKTESGDATGGGAKDGGAKDGGAAQGAATGGDTGGGAASGGSGATTSTK